MSTCEHSIFWWVIAEMPGTGQNTWYLSQVNSHHPHKFCVPTIYHTWKDTHDVHCISRNSTSQQILDNTVTCSKDTKNSAYKALYAIIVSSPGLHYKLHHCQVT
jgi:hypothetical protein